MGVRPLLGHDFNDNDDQEGRPRVVMLSYGLWQRSFAGDETVVGRHLNLSGNDYEVVGVLPSSFQFPQRDLDYWTPLILDAGRRQARGLFFMDVVGRLGDGVRLPQAQAEMDSIARQLSTQFVVDRNLGVALVGLKDDLTGSIRRPLLVLAGAVVFILLICCANIASMVSARATVRERELSIRTALGASRKRVIRQLLGETVALFVCGGALGVGVAYLGLIVLLRIAPPELQQLRDTHLDLTMIAFTFAVSAVSGLIFGVRPALHASRANTADALKESGRSLAGRVASRRFRTVLTVGEIALAMVLLTGAGLLIRSFQRLQQIPLGFDARSAYIAPIQLPRAKYAEDRQATTFFETLIERMKSTPGVESAGAISNFLLGPLPDADIFTIEGRAETIFKPLSIDVVTPEVFSVMKIPLLKGRLFDSRDRADSMPVAIINASTANRYWPDRDPIGQRFTYGRGGSDASWLTIVGVVADTRRAGIDRPVFTESYLPLSQQPERMLQVVVRSTMNAADVRKALTAAVHELDRDQPLASFGTLDNALNERTAARRFVVFLLSLFAVTAVTIAGVGIYGLIAYLVAQRRQELGVRIALGATPADVAGLVLGNVMAIAGIGLVAGGVSAWMFSRALEGLLFGVGRLDAASYVAAAIGVTLTSLISAIVPTVLALRIDPIIALRHD
jgi:putative ABC transport system permease protein